MAIPKTAALFDGARPTILSFCAGAGMLDIGLETAWEFITGVRPRVVGYVEREAAAAAVLMARMEEESLEPAPVLCGDLTAEPWGRWRGCVDILTAGFPCQPASVAGARAGVDDERWIWPSIARSIRDIRPALVVLENVAGLLTVRGGFDAVLASLDQSGYVGGWRCIRASDVGAPHRRERVFFLAYCDDVDRRSGAQRIEGEEGKWRARHPIGGSDGGAREVHERDGDRTHHRR